MMGANNPVITGISAITPLGNALDTVWHTLINKGNAVRRLTIDPGSNRIVKVAAYLDADQFNHFCPKYQSKRTDRSTVLALNAVDQLMSEQDGLNPAKIGVIVGTGFGITELADQLYAAKYRDGSRLPPHTITACMENATASQIAMTFGFKGYNSTLFTACSAGTNAIGTAYRLIKHGYADSIIVVGVDASLTAVMLEAWVSLRAASMSEDPQLACAPFSANRSGLVLGEGVGALLIESQASAEKRGAKIWAFVTGYATNCDAGHLTQSDLESQTSVMQEALKDAGENPDSVDMISSHGTSTPVGDKAEAQAIHQVFGDNGARVPVNALKSQLGHTIGASGVLEVIFSVLMMEHGMILPTINYQEDPTLGVNVVSEATSASINCVLKNSFGFGGNNASLVLKKC